jgi:DME family drug/metabolite transporter
VLAVLWFGLRDRSVFALRQGDTVRMILFGLVSVTAFYLALIYAFRYSSVAVGTLLLYLAPALVTVGAALWLNDPLTRVKVGALGLSLAGLLLIVEPFRPGGLGVSIAGIAFGLASAVTYGSYSLIAKPLMARYPPATLLVWNLPVGATGLVLVKLAVSPGDWPAPSDSVAIALYCGLVITLVPVGLYTVGLSRIPASEASILATMEPVVAAVLAFVVLDERLGPAQLLGGAAIIGSVVLLAARGRRTRVTRWTSPARRVETPNTPAGS